MPLRSGDLRWMYKSIWPQKQPSLFSVAFEQIALDMHRIFLRHDCSILPPPALSLFFSFSTSFQQITSKPTSLSLSWFLSYFLSLSLALFLSRLLSRLLSLLLSCLLSLLLSLLLSPSFWLSLLPPLPFPPSLPALGGWNAQVTRNREDGLRRCGRIWRGGEGGRRWRRRAIRRVLVRRGGGRSPGWESQMLNRREFLMKAIETGGCGKKKRSGSWWVFLCGCVFGSYT